MSHFQQAACNGSESAGSLLQYRNKFKCILILVCQNLSCCHNPGFLFALIPCTWPRPRSSLVWSLFHSFFHFQFLGCKWHFILYFCITQSMLTRKVTQFFDIQEWITTWWPTQTMSSLVYPFPNCGIALVSYR